MFFHRRKDPVTGAYTIVPAEEPQSVQPITIAPPAGTTLKTAKPKRFRCTACETKFAALGIFSMHFNRRHKELVVDRETWRTYVETLEAPK